MSISLPDILRQRILKVRTKRSDRYTDGLLIIFADRLMVLPLRATLQLYKSHTVTEVQAWTWRKLTYASQPEFLPLLQLMLRVDSLARFFQPKPNNVQ